MIELVAAFGPLGIVAYAEATRVSQALAGSVAPGRDTSRSGTLRCADATATMTYGYNAIGNLASTTGAATSTYTWDYRNRMIAAWVSGATSTHLYDHTIARMRQVVGSTTSDDPNKFFSIATVRITAT
jgi:hypothetical protein